MTNVSSLIPPYVVPNMSSVDRQRMKDAIFFNNASNGNVRLSSYTKKQHKNIIYVM